VFGTIAALYFAREIFIPSHSPLVLTFLLTPVAALLQRWHSGRVVSVLATVLVAVAAAGGIGWIIANQLVDVANQLPLYRQNIDAKIAAFHLPATGQVGSWPPKACGRLRRNSPTRASLPRPPLPQGPTRRQSKARPRPCLPFPFESWHPPQAHGRRFTIWARLSSAPLGRADFVLIFTVFMLFKREDLRNRLLRLAGLGRLNVMTQALDDASGRVSRYLLDAGAGECGLWNSGVYWRRSLLDWRAQSGAMGRGRRHLADCAVRGTRLRRRCRSRSRWPCSTAGSGRCACSCWWRASN